MATASGMVTLDGQEVETVQASNSNGVLTVRGTNGNDNLKFIQSNGWFGLQGGKIGWYSAATVTSVVINLRGGDDHVSLESLVNGGQQALTATFTINSGAGNETVHLANGEDVTFSGTGHQLVATASGLVTLDGQVLDFGDTSPPPPPPQSALPVEADVSVVYDPDVNSPSLDTTALIDSAVTGSLRHRSKQNVIVNRRFPAGQRHVDAAFKVPLGAAVPGIRDLTSASFNDCAKIKDAPNVDDANDPIKAPAADWIHRGSISTDVTDCVFDKW